MKDKSEKKPFPRYEKRLCLLIFLSTVTNSLSSLQFLSTHYTPPFHCSAENSYSKANETTARSSVTHGALNNNASVYACFKEYAQGVNTTEDRESCGSYEFTGSVRTVISEFGLVCDKAWIKPTLVSMYMVGKMVGGLVGGCISDRFGRRTAFLLFTFLQFALSIATSFASTVIMYGVALAMSGLTSVGNFEAIAVLGVEMVSPERRGLAYFMAETGYAVGYMMLSLFVYLFTSWRWFLVFGGLAGIVYIPYFWLLDESPVWLLATGRKKKAEAVLRKIATYNGQQTVDVASTIALVETKKSEESRAETICSTCAQMTKACFLMGRLAIVLFAWTINALTYYVLTLNNESLSGDRYLNIFFGSLTELLSSFIYFFVVNTLGRRKSYMSFMAFTGVAVAASSFLELWHGAASVTAVMLARLTIAVSYNVLYAQTGELFPTNIRSSILALSSASSRIGSILSPFVIYVGESGDATAPSVGMAVAIFLSAFLYLFIPETKNTKLPQTIEEAKQLKSLSLEAKTKNERKKRCNDPHRDVPEVSVL